MKLRKTLFCILSFVKKSIYFLIVNFCILLNFTAVFANESLKNSNESVKKPSYISIGTGSVNGIYYPLGGSICKILNGANNFKTKCFAESTSGSVYNITALRSSKIDFGFSQHDWLYNSYNGKDIFEKIGEDKNIRTVFTAHTESVVVITKKNQNIKSIKDLAGKRISIGLPDSGTRWTIQRIFETVGITKDNLKNPKELNPSEEMKLFCSDDLDAMFIVYGNPNLIAKEMIDSCGGEIIGIEQDYIDKIIAHYPFYIESIIPKSYYNLSEDIKTIGIKSSFVVNKNLSDDIVFQITKLIATNLNQLLVSNQILLGITKNTISENPIIPFHNGAVKYYKSVGAIKEPSDNNQSHQKTSQNNIKNNQTTNNPVKK